MLRLFSLYLGYQVIYSFSSEYINFLFLLVLSFQILLSWLVMSFRVFSGPARRREDGEDALKRILLTKEELTERRDELLSPAFMVNSD